MTEAATRATLQFISSMFNDTSIGDPSRRPPHHIPTPTAIPVPTWKTQDIIRLVILPLLFLLGAPLNLAALSHLMTERKTSSSVAKRMHLLKLHLNISDLMILFIYTASQICWLITYEWRGGEVLCRVVKFSHTLSFGISSNVVVCIAFDRLASIFESKRRRSGERRKPGLRRVKISLALAWTVAVACALPQFLVWTTYRPFPHSSWTQCVSVFFVQEAAAKRSFNYTLAQGTASGHLLITKTGYAAFHVLVIFWIPALIIAVCYLNVMAWLVCQGRRRGGDSTQTTVSCCLGKMRNRLSSNANNNTVDTHGRYSSISRTTKPTRVGVVTAEDGACQTRTSILRNSYGALEPVEIGPAGHPTSPKGSGCSSTPLLATAVGDGTTSRNASANMVMSAAVLDLQRVKRRAIRSSVLLVIAYIASWLPYNVIAIWGLIDELHYRRYGSSVSFSQYLIVLNSVINPFLYGTVGRLKRYLRDQ